MRQIVLIIAVITGILILFFSPARTQAQQEQGGATEEDIIDSGPLAPQPEGAPVAPEDLEMEREAAREAEAPEEEAPAAPAQQAPGQLQPPRQTARPPAAGAPAAEAGVAGEGEEARQVVIDSLVNMNYVFNGSPDSFVLKYHVHLEGRLAAATAVIKGTASINTEVTGFLAKWPTGNCKLNVNIPDSPFEMIFRKTAEDKATIDIKFTNPITETWESQCTFQDAPDAKFNTKGDPEKWLAKALEKARPPLTRMTVNLDPEESTTMKFEISKQMIKDPPLGTAEVDGTGVITINPGAGG